MHSRPKKMLVISNMYPSSKDPYYGTFVNVFFEGLKDSDEFIPKLVAIKGRKRSLLSKLLAYMVFYTKILWEVSAHNFDFIYIHTITHPTPPLRIVSVFKKLNTVYNIHGDDLLTTTILADRLLRLSIPLLKSSKAIVVPSEYFRDVLIREIPFTKDKKIIISPSGGVSKIFFKNDAKINDIPIIGYVSRIDEGKGWNVLLNALTELRDKHIVFEAHFYGRGDQELELRSSIEKNGLSENVVFYGPKTHEELSDIYKTFDVFIFPTTRVGESLGLVGIEAMASSTPVIGSDIGGVKSYINKGVNGFLFEPGNSNDLADKIYEFLSLNKEDRLKMGQAAYYTAVSYESSIVNQKLFSEILQIE